MVDVKGYSIKSIVESYTGAYTDLHGLEAKVKDSDGSWTTGKIAVYDNVIYFESNDSNWEGGHTRHFDYQYSWHVKDYESGTSDSPHRFIVTQGVTEKGQASGPFDDVEPTVQAAVKEGIDLSSLLEDDDEIVLSNKLK